MEIRIRQWNTADLSQIERAWLGYCRNAARSDMRFRPYPERKMKEWLKSRYGMPSSFGLIAEREGGVAGFLIGRVDEWESVPPVIQPRRLGIIDAVHVREEFRRQGIGSRLIEHAMELLRGRKVVAVETSYDAWSEAAAKTWKHAGFDRWMVHAFRLL